MRTHPSKTLAAACAEWAVRLAALHPDDLAPNDRMALKGHMQNCTACAAVYAAYQEVDARILSLPLIQPSAQQVSQLEALIRDGMPDEQVNKPAAPIREARNVPLRPHTGRSLVGSRLSLLAAVLIVALLAGSALLLFSSRHPSIVGGVPGTLYTISYSDGTAYALDAVTGKIEWRTPLHIKPDEAALISHDMIFITSQDGLLYALRESDGKLLWHRSYKAISSANGRPLIGRSIVSDGTAVYIATVTGLYAWRVSDGATMWRHAPPAACSQSGIAPPCNTYPLTVSNGILYAYFDGLYALRTTDGATLWHDQRFLSWADEGSSLVVVKNRLYVASAQGDAVFVLQADNGHTLDRIPASHSNHIQLIQLLAKGEMVYFNSGNYDVYAVRSGDDKILWHKHFADKISLVAADESHLYYSSISFSVVPKGTPTLPSTTRSPSSLIERLNAVSATNGSFRWSWQYPSGTFQDGVAAGSGMLYVVGGTQAGIYALHASDGKLVWHALANTWLARVAVV